MADLGDSEAREAIIAAMYDKLFRWARHTSQRTTRSEDQRVALRKTLRRRGVVLGIYDVNDVPLDLTFHYRDRKAKRHKQRDQ